MDSFSPKFLIILTAAVINNCYPTNGLNLEAKLSQARFPTSQYFNRAIYDDDDTIYIFGGYIITTLIIKRTRVPLK
jgi:hypothetical protein